MRFILFIAVCSSISAQVFAVDAFNLSDKHQLFLDDTNIASMDNIKRTIHPAQKSPQNPVLKPEEEWEGPVALLYGSVIEHKGVYRMWYYSTLGTSYAESIDGVHWNKPNLGLFKVDGHDTNVVVQKAVGESPASLPHYYELFGVYKDEHEVDPARRFKLGYLSLQKKYEGPREDPFHRTQRRGLGVAVSPDGFTWTSVDPWATEAICDGATHWMQDPDTHKIRIYGRSKYKDPEVLKAWGDDDYITKYYWGRVVASTSSDDFIHWELKDPATAPIVMAPDAEDELGTEIYGMAVFKYESIYIGLAQRFHNRPGDAFLDVQLAVSHDGVQFKRVGDRTPFIACGDVGEWDRFRTSLANNPPIAVGDNLRFYYSGRLYRHGPYKGPDYGVVSGAIGFAEIKRDRFVSLGASYDGGTVVTKPFMVSELKDLHINAKADFGTVRVELLNQKMEVLKTAKPIQQEGLAIPVLWESATDNLETEFVHLRFTLENALLYSYWVE